jgi:Zn finger protein HypA/HybF involved in hydrogenase expression
MLNPRPTLRQFKKEVYAHKLTLARIRNGFIARQANCQECKKICHTQAHHPDYSKPKEIQWLCPKCHSQKRRDLRNFHKIQK